MKLNCKHSGDGEPIVLLHGLFGSASNLGSVARALEEKFSVYALDLRNHGESPHAQEMDLSMMAEDVLQTMDEHNLAKAHLLGHSLGGKTAMQLALDHTQRVCKLVVADIAPVQYEHEHSAILRGLTAIAEQTIESRKQADEILRIEVSDQGVRGFLLKNLTRTAEGKYKLGLNLEAIKANYANLAAGNSAGSFNGDTLFISGERSTYMRAEYKEEIFARFPQAQFKTIANAGHWLHAEQPEQFNRMALQFLSEN